MNISLTPKLKYVDGKVQSGMYHSASEVIREGLRLLKEKRNSTRRNSRSFVRISRSASTRPTRDRCLHSPRRPSRKPRLPVASG